MTENKTELLPCPFCGSEPTFDYGPRDTWIKVFCSNRSCISTAQFSGEQDAYKAWNTRATVTPSDKAALMALNGIDLISEMICTIVFDKRRDISTVRKLVREQCLKVTELDKTIRAALQQPEDVFCACGDSISKADMKCGNCQCIENLAPDDGELVKALLDFSEIAAMIKPNCGPKIKSIIQYNQEKYSDLIAKHKAKVQG